MTENTSIVSALPKGFRVRPLTLDDAQDVTVLLRVCEMADLGVAQATEEEVLRSWSFPGMDLARDNWLVFAPNGQLVAYASLAHWMPTQLYSVPRIHPDYASTELYACLFAYIEERAFQLLPQAPADARVTLSIFGSARNRLFTRVVEQAGFALVRSSWLMQINMSAPPPAPRWPEGITLRPFTLDMARAVHATDEEAFRDHWGHVPTPFEVFEQWFLKRPAFDPALWFIPFDGEQIAGIALCKYQSDLGWVGSLGVRRPWRRKGLALALLYHAFGEFYRRGTHKVGLDVDAQNLTGATRLYERAGMHVVFQSNRYQKELRPGIELGTQALET